MKTIIIGMAAASMLAMGAPAAAQYANQNSYQNQDRFQNNANGNIGARIEQLRVRIQTGVQSGVITRNEAPALRQQLRALTQLERQYSANGLSGQERSVLQQRLRTLRQQVRAADGGQGYGQYDRDDDYGQYGQNGQYGNSGQYDRAYDRNNDGFDDRDHDRDGRWDDERNDGQYEQPARGGIGGVIDNLLGRGGLRVGQRATSSLYALPSQYRNQYRDGNGGYFRTDGRQIYQIDARTQTVVRVYAMNR